MNYNESAIYSLLGKRIRNARIACNLTQQQLADMLPLARTTLTNIESGGQKIPVHLLYEISYALDMELSEFLPSKADLEREGLDLPPITASFVQQFIEDEI